jgi:hypothetical protein
MAMISAPFPLPLKAAPRTGKTLDNIGDAKGNFVAIFKTDVNPAALEYMVSACNAHPALVEAVQLAIQHMPYSQDPEVGKAVEKMHAALKLAGAA